MNVPIRPTAIDLDHLEQTLATAGWAMIARKIEATREEFLRKALKSPSWEETLEERGKMRGLELALDVPNKLRSEITERLKKEGK